MKQDMLVILDLGSTENTAVARAVRALGVTARFIPTISPGRSCRER